MGPHQGQPLVHEGAPLGAAPVVIMVHGRNAAPANILSLVPRLGRPDLTYLAPSAAGRTWYPLSFMADIAENEPNLTSALDVLASLVAHVEAAGVPRSRIILLGFSQGACLASEFAVRHATRFGGLVLFTGGLIGPPGTRWERSGTFDGTPIFIGSGDPDHHVPVSRVEETAAVFRRMGAAVTTRIYPGRPHTVGDAEIPFAQAILDEVSRVTVFSGTGSLSRLSAELKSRDLRRLLVLTTPRGARDLDVVRNAIGDRLAGVSDTAAPHVPVASVRTARGTVDDVRPDALLAFGGGSSVGLAKALALEYRLPIVAVPTTYSGSEMTAVWGTTDGGQKHTGRDPIVAPRVVVYEPALTINVPPRVSAASGMNAMAHAVEALYSATAGPLAAAAAEQAIRSLAESLPVVVVEPANERARSVAQRGAYLAGVALQHATMGLHHKLAHVLGGAFGLPHADTHALLLPHVVAFNAPAAPEAMDRIAEALGSSDAAAGLAAFNRRIGLTGTLSALGFRREDIERAAELAVASAYPNPRPVTAEDVKAILRAAL